MVTKTPVEIVETPAPQSNLSQGFVVFLLIVSVAINALCLYFLLGYSLDIKAFTKNTTLDSSLGIKKILLDLEYEKVGGKENYDLLQKYTQMQIKEQITQIRNVVNGGTNPTPTQPTEEKQPVSQGTLTPEEMKKILDDASIEGNKNAPVAVIEYSDMECPFCMRQYHDTKLFPTILAQYGDKVSLAFKNNRGVNHKGTEVKALGALCAAKIGGDVSYQKFYKGVMDGSTNESGVLDVARLPDIAKSSGVDIAIWQKCVDAKETLPRFSAQTSEAQRFDLGGTPGTLILNTKTGKYATVEGAYPYATFTAKIDELLK